MIFLTQYKLVQQEITIILITIGSITRTAPPYVNFNNVIFIFNNVKVIHIYMTI